MVAVELSLLGVVGAAGLECREPAAEAGELIRRELDDVFGDFFDFHVTQYSTAAAWLSRGMGSVLCGKGRGMCEGWSLEIGLPHDANQ